jgi:hypothetical protein
MAIRAALVLGAAAILAAAVFGVFFRSARATRDTIQVTGAATEPFEADVVKWSITISRQVPTDGVADGYTALREDRAQVVRRLGEAGIPEETLNVQPVTANPRWDQFGSQVGFSLDQGLTVVAENGGRELEAIALDPGPLLESGVVLQYSRLEYFFSGIDELKHRLLSQATADARRRAEEIAGGSEMAIDKIVSARAGVFQITEPFSTEVSDYGVHSTATRKKEITVTVHATFSVD